MDTLDQPNSILKEYYVNRTNSNRPIKSRWDAKFLINNIMGMLAHQQVLNDDLVLGVVSTTIRGYLRGRHIQVTGVNELEALCMLKQHASQAALKSGKDSQVMRDFLETVRIAESGMEGYEYIQVEGCKLSGGFPMDIFTDGELVIITEKSREYFNAKFYSSDCEPRKGMFVFDDEAGLEAFSKWMLNNHPELVHQSMGEGDEETDLSQGEDD